MKKNVLITFLGNIYYDTRCYNLFDALNKKDFSAKFVGFDWTSNNLSVQEEQISVHKLSRKYSSIFFYLRFNLLLLKSALFEKFEIIFAEDLYTLPVCIIAGKFKRAKIIYDSRELFTHLAGLKDKKLLQSFWSFIEKLFIHKADIVLVTGEMDKDFLIEKYSLTNICLLRNLPLKQKPDRTIDFYELLKINPAKKILLYQGVVLHGRGLGITFNVLQKSETFVLVILGEGDLLSYYKNLASTMNVSDKVFFLGRINQTELINYTSAAFLGLALIENVSLSYYYALPNKLFEYIMAETPAVVSNLPQMKHIIEKYNVGLCVDLDNEDLLEKLEQLVTNEHLYKQLKQNCRTAAKELCWENEINNLFERI